MSQYVIWEKKRHHFRKSSFYEMSEVPKEKKNHHFKSWIPKISGFQTSYRCGCNFICKHWMSFFLAFKLGLCAIQKWQIMWKSSLFSFNCSTEWISYTVLSGTWWPGPSQHTPLQTQLWVYRSDVCPSQLCHLSLTYMPLLSLLYDEGWTTPNRTERARFKRENAYAVIYKRLHSTVTIPCYITHI